MAHLWGLHVGNGCAKLLTSYWTFHGSPLNFDAFLVRCFLIDQTKD